MTTIMYDDDGNMMDETIGNLFAQPVGKPTGPIPPGAPTPMDFDRPEKLIIGLASFFSRIPNEAAAVEFFEEKRWKGVPFCPHCYSDNIYIVPSGKPMRWRCRTGKHYFSVRIGTIFEESKTPLWKWALAIHLLHTARKSVAAKELEKILEVSYPTAWTMAHRIRRAQRVRVGKLSGIIQIDETWVGGKAKNIHASKKKATNYKWTDNKMMVMCLKEKGGRLIAKVIPNPNKEAIEAVILANVRLGSTISTIWTDEAPYYADLGKLGYDHHFITHKNKQYVDDDGVTTNDAESMWALLKRAYVGTFHWFSFKHLERYVDEFQYRLNAGPGNGFGVIGGVIEDSEYKRLTWKDIMAPKPGTGEVEPDWMPK